MRFDAACRPEAVRRQEAGQAEEGEAGEGQAEEDAEGQGGEEEVATAELLNELDRQVETLRAKGYPELGGLEQLAERLPELPETDGIPFVIVVRRNAHATMPLVALGGKQGFTTMDAGELDRFTPIHGVELPDADAYLVADVDTGADTLNVTPDDALETIVQRGRSPLTIDEGVAVVTHYPEVLKTRNCFSLLGSRCGDRRVTALWLSGGRPRLGWCWAGNPHTWLGSASCAARYG